MCNIFQQRVVVPVFYHHARMIDYYGCNKISNECRREPDIIAIDEAGDLAGEPRNVPRDMTGDIIAIDEA